MDIEKQLALLKAVAALNKLVDASHADIFVDTDICPEMAEQVKAFFDVLAEAEQVLKNASDIVGA